MDWIEPWQGGRRGGGWLSPFYPSSDIWDYGDRGRGGDDTSALAHAHVDWRETPTAHVFLAELPGVRKEEVKVQVEDNNILQISGERVKEEEDQSDKWHRVERRRGSFVRRFRLPENANLGDVKCSLENGVLRVVVPKIEEERSQKNVRYIDIA